MARAEAGQASDHWMVLRLAFVWSGLYLAWLVAFERWLEPLARRCAGAVLRREIVWVPGGRFSVWGLRERDHPALEGLVGALGGVVVLGSALLPPVLLSMMARIQGDAAAAASGYLLSIPLTAVFVLRVLRR